MDGQQEFLFEPAGSGGARRYRKPLLKVRWRDIKLLLAESYAGWSRHNAAQLGAALAFYTLLSVMPLLLVAISIAGLLFGTHAAEAGVLRQIRILFGGESAGIISALLKGAQSRGAGVVATILGLLTLLFGASGMWTELRHALDAIWEVPSREFTTLQEITHYARERLWSFGLVLATGFVLTAAVWVTTWVTAAGAVWTSFLSAHVVLLHVATAGVSFVGITILFAVVYKVAPNVELEWRDVALGAAVTSLFFTVGNLLLGFYLGKASFASTYGAAASTVLLALWVYYSSQIFFLGAEFTKAFSRHFGSHPGATASLIVPAPAASGPLVVSRR